MIESTTDNRKKHRDKENRAFVFESFNYLCISLGLNDLDKVHRYFSFLANYYEQSGRMYHDFRHIISCLKELDEYIEDNLGVEKGREVDLEVLEWAILYHDLFQDILLTGGKNEEISKEIASKHLEHLGLDARRIGIVGMVIWSTFTRNPSFLDESVLICDLDYAILGQEIGVVKNYADGIFYEYVVWGGLSAEEYKDGRRKFLEGILKLDRIYFTDYFYKKYEEKARENVKIMIERL